MATGVLILGESGSGKSSSTENLPSTESFYINVQGKDLPFKGWKSKYKPVKGNEGNYIHTDNTDIIMKTLLYVSNTRPEIKHVVVDDNQYLMANEFMRRAKEKTFDKFTDIGSNMWKLFDLIPKLRGDLKVYFLTHSETVPDPAVGYKIKMKTVGKLLDEKITPEGMFTIVLGTTILKQSQGEDKEGYYFITQSDGTSPFKSPKGMFDKLLIPNDLSLVSQKIDEYYG